LLISGCIRSAQQQQREVLTSNRSVVATAELKIAYKKHCVFMNNFRTSTAAARAAARNVIVAAANDELCQPDYNGQKHRNF
jgi:UDP-3-O-[3-hydroxymyristoyl] glucosamine N-acyltransferase